MKSVKFLLSIALFLVISVGVLAQNTDQSENECYEGGALDGHCSNTDVDLDGDVEQDDIDWMFTCGYYLTLVDDVLTIGNAIGQSVLFHALKKSKRKLKR